MSNRTRTALVTGANRGIGRAIAEGLAARNCRVYLGVREAGRASEAIESIRKSGGNATELIIDVTSDESIKRAEADFSSHESSLNILVNNAGIFLEKRSISIREIAPEIFQKEFDVNTLGPLRVSNAFYENLVRGTEPRIINMSSRAGQLSTMSDPFGPGYSISKTALNALTCQQASAFSQDSISVNSMSPGWVRTDMGGDAADLTPAEGADTAVWLALDCKHEVTGRFFHNRKEIAW